MTELHIQKVPDPTNRTLPVFSELEDLMRKISQRAFERFSRRGFGEGFALEDWLAAEREFCWPMAELSERDKEFELNIALPGFEPADVELTTAPREIIVHAKSKQESRQSAATEKPDEAKVLWSEFRSNDVYRRVELPMDIDLDNVRAVLKKGVLRIHAPKAAKQRSEVRAVQVKAA